MTDFNDEHYRRLLDALPCYVTLQDRELQVLWCNDLCRRDFGRHRGKTCYELYGVNKEKCDDCPVEKTFLDGLVHSREMMVKTKKDQRINVIIYSSPIRNEKEEITSVLETAVNITSVK
jgi:PAS domain-containing protein